MIYDGTPYYWEVTVLVLIQPYTITFLHGFTPVSAVVAVVAVVMAQLDVLILQTCPTAASSHQIVMVTKPI